MKILWVSDCPDNKVNTGYATATRLIAVELMKRGHKFVFGSQGSQEACIQNISVGEFSCKSYGFGLGKFLSAQAIGEIDKLENPDLIITMADWQMIEGMLGLSGYPAFSKWVCYAPVDGDMLSNHWDHMIHNIPYMVYMSPRYGASVCEPRRFGYCNYVPLPIDLDQHFLMPPSERKAFRAECKQRIGWDVNTYTSLTVARNQWRKNYPEIIKAAKLLKLKHPGAFSFVLHCCPVESMGWDLPRLIHYYNVGDCVAISDQQVDYDGKNKLFNSADLFLLPSLGEGFGIPLIEAALYELPIFTTDDTANHDLTVLMSCSEHNLPYTAQWQHGPTIPRPYVCAEEIVKAYESYLQWGCRYNLEKTRKAAEELFTVKKVADTWEGILTQASTIRLQRFGTNLGLAKGELSV